MESASGQAQGTQRALARGASGYPRIGINPGSTHQPAFFFKNVPRSGDGGGHVADECKRGQYINHWKIRSGSLVDAIQGRCTYARAPASARVFALSQLCVDACMHARMHACMLVCVRAHAHALVCVQRWEVAEELWRQRWWAMARQDLQKINHSQDRNAG